MQLWILTAGFLYRQCLENMPISNAMSILVSALEKFRVWDREAWKKIFVEAEDKLMQDPDFLGDLGL